MAERKAFRSPMLAISPPNFHSQGQIATANKIAMSKALGAAFLNHQVEQLEKTISSNGPASGNWRDRQYQLGRNSGLHPSGATALPPKAAANMNGRRKNVEVITPTKSVTVNKTRDTKPAVDSSAPGNRRSSDEKERDADIIIVDSSVLVHALDYIKKWSRNGRQEIIIVPLEALNTLDLLKKGTTPLAQRARAASRILEAQVGTNPRIRVQQDDAFVLWDKIPFTSSESHEGEKSPSNSPEWVRRTICCARWEVDHAKEELKADSIVKPRVVLAVCTGNQSVSPITNTLKLSDAAAESALTPVPLPAPTIPQPNKHEPRSNGNLVSHWASRAGIALLDVKPSSMGGQAHPRASSDDERPKRTPKGRRQNGSIENGKGLVERSPAVLAMMEMVSHPTKVVRVLARGEKLDPDP